jgi:hypothetical protein
MTVRQLTEELTIEELVSWAAFFDLKNEQEEKERRKSEIADTRSMGSR